MIVIDVDTELMTEVASKAKIANSEVEEALNLLNKVALHYDWECNEKKAINEYTIKNKTAIKKLHDKTESYLNAVVQAATEVKNAEISICNSFNDLEVVIGKSLEIIKTIGDKKTNSWGAINSAMQKIIADINYGNSLVNYHSTNLGKGIRIVPFEIMSFDE